MCFTSLLEPFQIRGDDMSMAADLANAPKQILHLFIELAYPRSLPILAVSVVVGRVVENYFLAYAPARFSIYCGELLAGKDKNTSGDHNNTIDPKVNSGVFASIYMTITSGASDVKSASLYHTGATLIGPELARELIPKVAPFVNIAAGTVTSFTLNMMSRLCFGSPKKKVDRSYSLIDVFQSSHDTNASDYMKFIKNTLVASQKPLSLQPRSNLKIIKAPINKTKQGPSLTEPLKTAPKAISNASEILGDDLDSWSFDFPILSFLIRKIRNFCRYLFALLF